MKEDSTKLKILIAEDRKPMAKALALKLERAGYQVQIAEDGEIALDFLKKDKFNIVLLDLVMPKVDGFTILAEMQARNIKTPVIVLSNLSQDEDERRAKELGAVEYFIKSDIPINEVVKRVSNILSQNEK